MKYDKLVVNTPLLTFKSILLLFTIFASQLSQAEITEHPHKASELLVKFKPGMTASIQSAPMFQRFGVRSVKGLTHSSKFNGTVMTQWNHVILPMGSNLNAVREQMLLDPMIESVELNYTYSINLVPNDPMFSQLWGLHNTGQTGGAVDADIDGPETWNAGTGSFATLTAVIDTGVDYNHPDLAANIWTNPGEIPGNGIDDDGNGYIDDIHGYDFVNNDGDPFDDNLHGTHVSGTIAAVGNNGIGVAGVNWQARIMAVKVFSAQGRGSLAEIIPGILYASANGAKVMNNSWGGGGFSQALLDAINVTNTDGALFIAAAGNSNNNNDVSPSYPATYDVANIIAVAATDHFDAKATFSSYGATTVDLGAPGVDVMSTLPGARYGLLSGTSMATPHVAGAATLLMAISPQLTHLQVKEVILNSVDPVPSMAGITLTGGRLNISQVVDPDLIAPDPVSNLLIDIVGPLSISLTWSATGDDGSVGNATQYDLRYSTSPIDETNFDLATSTGSILVSGPAGTLESYIVNGLNPNTTHYFAIKVLDDVGNTSLISNLVSATTLNSNIHFHDFMETGMSKWIIENGFGGQSLWHISPHRSNTPSNAMYYGVENTLNYNTGTRNSSTLTTIPIDLRGVFGPRLSFIHYLDIDPQDPAEIILIEVSGDGGASWKDLFDTNKGTNKLWQTMDFKLNDFEDQVIQIRFSFDSGDAIANRFEGWVIDDVRVYTVSVVNQQPIANPGGPYTGLAGQAIIFNGTGSTDPDGDALTYAWNFGDGTSGTGASPSHTYTLAGSYVVSLIVNDGALDSTSVSTNVTIVDAGGNQPPVADPGGPYSSVINQTVTFDGTGSTDPNGDVLTYTWDFGDGTTAIGVSPVHAYTNAGNFLVTLIVNDGSLNSTAATTNTTVSTGGGSNLPPFADAGGPYQGHWGKSVEMNGDASSDPDGDLITYAWDFGDGTSGAGNAPKHTYSTPGIYNVTLTVSDGQASNTATTTTTINNQTPVADAGGPYNGAVGEGVELNGDASYDPDDDTLIFTWDFGDGSTGAGPGLVHIYTTAGIYTLTLTVSDGQEQNSATTSVAIQ